MLSRVNNTLKKIIHKIIIKHFYEKIYMKKHFIRPLRNISHELRQNFKQARRTGNKLMWARRPNDWSKLVSDSRESVFTTPRYSTILTRTRKAFRPSISRFLRVLLYEVVSRAATVAKGDVMTTPTPAGKTASLFADFLACLGIFLNATGLQEVSILYLDSLDIFSFIFVIKI